MNDKLVLIAAGGTGGHIYPGLAIAQAFERENPGLKVEFIGSAHGLENTLVPKAGYKLHHLAIGRLNRNVRTGERLKTVFLLPWVLIKAFWLMWKLKPRLVLGVGGAVTGPSVLAAALGRRPAFLWEPNAQPGLANRWLAPFVKECLVVFPEAARRLSSKRTFEVGLPIRQNIEAQGGQNQAVPVDRPLRVLVFGGSQGSRMINDVVSSLIVGNKVQNLELVHQTGPSDHVRVQQIYQNAISKVECLPFIHDMDQRYQWADLVVSRSGMGTVSELAAAGKAAVLIPLASAADNHQQHNAEALVAKGAAIMVLQKDLTVERMTELLTQLEKNRTRLNELSVAIRQFHRPRADQAIVRHLLEATT